jgi:hypothetical protein
MNPLTRAFRNAAAHACQRQRFPFTEFLTNRGLEAILIDADHKGYHVKEIAAQVLSGCCVSQGKFNNFQVGLLAVMKFLSDQYGPPNLGQVQMFQDLLTILNQGGSRQAIMGWLDTHYP